jgi:recombination protein RecR
LNFAIKGGKRWLFFMALKYPRDLSALIAFFKKFPGVGSKTAERLSFQLLKWNEKELGQFGEILSRISKTIQHCPECGCLMEENQCFFCQQKLHRGHLLCIISSPKDAFSIEATKSYFGLYHVIDHLLSPLEGRLDLNLDSLSKRIDALSIQEIIIALDSTLEGDATALYLKNHFKKHPLLKVSRLAFGLPVGSSLDYIDDSTLSRAVAGRQSF